MWRWLPLLVFALLGLLLAAGIELNRGRERGTVTSPLIGRPAPAFVLPALREGEGLVDGKDLRGRPWILNVWASWCVSCRAEHPVLSALARRAAVPVIGLNWKDRREDALAWLARFGDPYHAIAFDPDNRVGIEWGVYGTPETFVIDAEGVIRYKHVGPLTPEVVERRILPLLAATSR
jgi:cytochrome c biogenesis protein CcmG/thiol:disulfide interchange protein DsbE